MARTKTAQRITLFGKFEAGTHILRFVKVSTRIIHTLLPHRS
jgi:hypothetical protein